MRKQLKTSFLFTMISTVGLGLVYPAIVTGFGLVIPSHRPVLFRESAQNKDLFHGRPSMSGGDYSGASNLSLTNLELWRQVEERYLRETQHHKGVLAPRELVFASASGYDAHLSRHGALHQITRISQAHNLSVTILKQLVNHHTKEKLLGFIGTTRVNCIALNKDLEGLIAVTNP